MQEKQKKITSDFKKSFVNGISGCFGVACQTVGLLWHLNLKQECYRSGRRTKDAVIQLYRSGGIFRFYQGFFTAFRSASLARFGDNFFSSFITNELEKNKYMRNSSIFMKAAFVWAFASTWRIAMLPIDALD